MNRFDLKQKIVMKRSEKSYRDADLNWMHRAGTGVPERGMRPRDEQEDSRHAKIDIGNPSCTTYKGFLARRKHHSYPKSCCGSSVRHVLY